MAHALFHSGQFQDQGRILAVQQQKRRPFEAAFLN
jgi:hypothetical protein